MVAINRNLLLMKIEQEGDDTPLSPEQNAFLVRSLDFSPEIETLERPVARASLSPSPSRTGRIKGNITFQHEVVGSGVTDGSAPPVVAPLLRSCGFAETQFSGGGVIQTWPRVGNTGSLTLVDGGGTYLADTIRYVTLTVVTAGGSGVAVVDVNAPEMTGPDNQTIAAFEDLAVTVTDGTPITLADGATVVPTVVTDLAEGDKFVIQLAPPGYLYTPVSVGFEAASSRVYYDGLVHPSNRCRGNVSMSATAGSEALFDFTYTGDWVNPTDEPLPTNVVYHELLPPQVELADVRVDNIITSCPASFGFDLANNLAAKECANEPQGYAGSIITGRVPTVSFDPDFGPEANYAYWQKLTLSEEIDFSYTIGTVRGNSCHVLSHIQIRNLGYGNRTEQRIYNIEGNAVSRAGDDEITLYFF